MILTRRFLPIAAILAGAALFYALGAAFLAHAAHADTTAATAPAAGLDWRAWVAIGLAALAGLRVLVDTLLAFFGKLAPMTKTTVDDRVRDELQSVHDKLDSLAGVVGQLVPNSKPQTASGTIGGAQ